MFGKVFKKFMQSKRRDSNDKLVEALFIGWITTKASNSVAEPEIYVRGARLKNKIRNKKLI